VNSAVQQTNRPKVLFLALIYADVSVDSDIYTELIQSIAELGVDIRVLAPSLDQAGQGLGVEGSILVFRIRSKSLFSQNLIAKAFNNLFLPIKYYFALNKYTKHWRPSWILVPTPPVTLAPLVWWRKIKCKAKSYLILRDIFPQNAVDLGLLRKYSPAYWLFRLLEKMTYCNSDHIGCMSPANIDYVLRRNSIRPERLHLLPNWIAEKHTRIQLSRSIARSKFGIQENELLCVFGGNLGKPQRVDFLLEVAHLLRNDTFIRFVVVGRGTEVDSFRSNIASRCLDNITTYSVLPRDEYQQLLAAADVGLILLNEFFTIPNIPSRLTGYWAAGVPVLAATDSATDLYDAFLKPFNGGKCVPMGDALSFVKELRWFAENQKLAVAMGENGRQAVIHNFTAKRAAEVLIEKIGASESVSC